MPIATGTRLGVYQVVSAIGAGGMGEVYQAQDTKLGRLVAIKVLPDVVAVDPERIARFEREAKVLASLNHPNIAGLFGMEQEDGRAFLIMELVEGDTLEERIAAAHAAGGFNPSDLLSIATQIAEGVESAHEKGIVHRDLKPANIKISREGRVKVLDFGLARAMAGEPAATGAGGLTHSPTLSMMATQAGMILGTAAYMSPEQAKGLQADHRSDVFSFGVVIYEMVTGRQPFRGETAPDVLASVLARDPDLAAIPSSLHPRLRDLIARCLEKNPRRRWQAIGDVRAELEMIATTPAAPALPGPTVVAAVAPLWKRAIPVVATAVVVLVATAAAMLSLRPVSTSPVARFSYALPAGQFLPIAGRPLLAISPDASQIVYSAGGRLLTRAVAEFESRPISGADTGGPAASGLPTFSPDGRWIAYYSFPDRAIKKIAITGGAAVTICAAATPPFGLSWSGENLLFSQPEGVFSVSSNGGTPTQVISQQAKAPEVLLGPRLLPGGEAVLMSVGSASVPWDSAQVVAHVLRTGERRVLVSGGSDARYLPSGHLVYARGGVLFAVPFDVKRLVVSGGPVPVVEGVGRGSGPFNSGFAHFAVSDNGALVYVPGPAVPASSSGTRDLVLADRSGSVERLKIPAANYSHPRFSPDGKRVAFGIDDEKESSIWIYDLAGTTAMRRLTFGSKDRFPLWTPDGQHVTFQSDREGDSGIFRVNADGGTPERLTKAQAGERHIPSSWSPSGDYLLFDVVKETEVTLWSFAPRDKTVSRVGDIRSTVPTGAQFSPDGHWIAYATSNAPAPRDTVYVQPFPATGSKFQISRTEEDGHHPIWSPDGKELSFIPNPGQFVAVSVNLKPSFSVSDPVPLPRRFTVDNAPTNVRSHDITPDGKRFIGISTASQDPTGTSANADIRVVLNWTEELKQRLSR